ncbi:hypothetical protein WA1_20950 [Scytonema hofmannii PCC 7110]|uniref:Uncharacterized protein n=1 Tax=Scytonema hofmannii PCC 7110 TaxID=128403 RepID=A0A139XCN1_9CYAN|nr:hypothetical protein [Scytonema hofmannii]KYC42435.1 hypothetical protein WA1_20950 [Scytonema hofmannii PCC 7110]
MSSILRVRFQENINDNSTDRYNDVPLSVEIINEEFEIVSQRLVFGTADINLVPGLYVVRAYLPSGEVAIANTCVEEGKLQEVRLKLSPPFQDWAWWSHFLGEAIHTEGVPSLSAFPQTWLCLWQYNTSASQREEQWVALSPSEWLQKKYENENIIICEVSQLPEKLHFLQLSSPIVPCRFLAIPPTYQEVVQIIISPSSTTDKWNSGLVKRLALETKVLTLNKKVEVFSHYLKSSLLKAASILSEEVLLDAERLSRKKIANPISAVIGGYYLLQIGAYEQMSDWLENLDYNFPWLPDGAIIHAYQLLGKPKRSDNDLTLARERLLEATHRGLGIPIYRQGLRLLIDALEMFAGEAHVQGESDELVEQSLKRVRNYAAIVDWNQYLTTFYSQQLIVEPKTGTTFTEIQENKRYYITNFITQEKQANKVVKKEDMKEFLKRRNYEIEIIEVA